MVRQPARPGGGARRERGPSRVAGFVCLAVAAAACGRNPDAAAQRYTAHGDEYMAVGRYDAAAIDYRNAIKATPNRVDPYLKLGEAQQLAGKAAEAYATFTR